MSKSINKAILIGRLGMDPELKQGSKTEFVKFVIGNPASKNGKEEMQWHHICAFGKQAQLCHNYLHKGDLCCIEGRLDSSSYVKNGEKRYFQSIIAESVTFLTPKRRPDTPQDSSLSVLDEVFG